MTQKCPEGKYYCHTMKKCKSIPRGYRVGRGGYLVQDEDKKNGKSKSNGNGGSHSNNNGNGNGNGNGSGNGGNGGVSEDVSYKDFVKDAAAAKERIDKKRAETRKRNNATVFQDKISGKGIKFYSKGRTGRIKSGKKIYD